MRVMGAHLLCEGEARRLPTMRRGTRAQLCGCQLVGEGGAQRAQLGALLAQLIQLSQLLSRRPERGEVR
eukprot:7217187-Prymnesium_polylepis.1